MNACQLNGTKKADAYLHSLKMSIQSRLSDYKRRGGINDIDAYHNDVMELVKTFDAGNLIVGDDNSKENESKMQYHCLIDVLRNVQAVNNVRVEKKKGKDIVELTSKGDLMVASMKPKNKL